LKYYFPKLFTPEYFYTHCEGAVSSLLWKNIIDELFWHEPWALYCGKLLLMIYFGMSRELFIVANYYWWFILAWAVSSLLWQTIIDDLFWHEPWALYCGKILLLNYFGKLNYLSTWGANCDILWYWYACGGIRSGCWNACGEIRVAWYAWLVGELLEVMRCDKGG